MFEDKILVFDLDGTLYNVGMAVEDLIDRKILEFFASHLHIPGDEAKALMQDIRSRYIYDVDAMGTEFPFDKKEFMDFTCDVDVSFLPKDYALDAKLKNMPQRKFILTDSTKKHVHDVLSAIGVSANNFAGIFDGHDMQYAFKYNKDGFRLFLDKYGLKAQDCLLFEDRPRNLEVADKMGFITISISPQEGEKPSFCDYWFADINQALEYFAQQSPK